MPVLRGYVMLSLFPLSTCFHISSFQVYPVLGEKLLAAITVFVIFSSGSAVVMKAFREMTVQVIWDKLLC